MSEYEKDLARRQYEAARAMTPEEIAKLQWRAIGSATPAGMGQQARGAQNAWRPAEICGGHEPTVPALPWWRRIIRRLRGA